MSKTITMSVLQLILAAVILIGLYASYLWLYPKYRVYSATQAGIAKLRESESSKQILVQQAQAEKDAAQLRADAIKIMGQVAKDYPEYRTQEYIGAFSDALRDGKIREIIYVPVEANLPILEAGKRRR